MNHLTHIQQTFVTAYAETGNATQSYLKASPGCRYSSARQNGYMLMQNPEIVEAIDALKEEWAIAANVNRETMNRELTTSAEQAKNAGDFKAYATIKNMIIKMYGLYEPEKVHHTGEQNITVIKTTLVKKEDKESGTGI